MSLLELKQEVVRLSQRDRQELRAHLVRLSQGTAGWRRATAQKIRAMQAGRRVTAEQLEARMARG